MHYWQRVCRMRTKTTTDQCTKEKSFQFWLKRMKTNAWQREEESSRPQVAFMSSFYPHQSCCTDNGTTIEMIYSGRHFFLVCVCVWITTETESWSQSICDNLERQRKKNNNSQHVSLLCFQQEIEEIREVFMRELRELNEKYMASEHALIELEQRYGGQWS